MMLHAEIMSRNMCLDLRCNLPRTIFVPLTFSFLTGVFCIFKLKT